MEDIIKLLPDAIANQIAAGEVIQRPASVVKELLENALDAGATRIQLILKDGGKQLIQVVDNGRGMSVVDARMAFERHATSKISSAEDLFHIRTMGFRGEALASIASVAQVEMKTRPESDEVGSQIKISASKVSNQDSCACPVGTQISVRNLFFNVPARRKFLKSDTVEMKHILDEFQRVALARSDLHFTLHHNDQEVYHLPPANPRQRIVSVLGTKANKQLIPVSEEADRLAITGFVGRPEGAKKTRGSQFLFVNKRFIKSGYLHHAIRSAYEELLGEDQHPLYCLYMEIDPARIDVNVHPTKHEIKFEDERLIYHFVKVSVRHALGQYAVVPTLDFDPDHSVATAKLGGSGSQEKRIAQVAGKGRTKDWEELFSVLQKPLEEENPQAELNLPDPLAPAVTVEGQSSESETPREKTSPDPYQIHGSFILSPIKSGFILIDQQAAHERILFEEYLQQLEGEPARIQQEMFPRTWELNGAEAQLIHSLLPALRQMGFDLQEFGPQTVILHGTPADLPSHCDALDLLQSMLQQHQSDQPLDPGNREALAGSLARHAAVKRGTTLDTSQMQNLIDRLFACTMPYKSPGGRHCFLTYELEELHRRFRG